MPEVLFFARLQERKRHELFVAAAILTPPDIISQVGLAVPLILLYEISILAATWMAPKPQPDAEAKD